MVKQTEQAGKAAKPRSSYYNSNVARAAFIVGVLVLDLGIDLNIENSEDLAAYGHYVKTVADALDATEPLMIGDFPDVPEMKSRQWIEVPDDEDEQ